MRSGRTKHELRRHFSGMRYGDLKKQVAEMVISELERFEREIGKSRRTPLPVYAQL